MEGSWRSARGDREIGTSGSRISQPAKRDHHHERAVARVQPIFSLDSGRLAYRVNEKRTSTIHVARLAGGAPERVCEGCGSGGWSSDGKRLLYVERSPDRILVLELGSGRSTALVQHATYTLHSASFEPQDRWICFNAVTPGRSRIFVARVQSVGLVPESEWIAVTNGRWDDQPQSLMNVGWGDLQLSVAADKIGQRWRVEGLGFEFGEKRADR